MKNFTVVETEVNFDGVDYVKVIGAFSTKEMAENFASIERFSANSNS
jgi:hypothetical protein